MIYTHARWADEAHTMVIGTDGEGNSETVPWDHRVFRQPLDGPVGFVEAGGVIEAYEAPVVEPQPQILGPVSAASLTISGGEVLGIETSVNFGAAFMIDVDTYWVFFMRPEPDTSYLVLANVPYTKYTDYIEIKAVDLAEVGLTTWRVK